METEIVLWITMIVGWFLFGLFARLNSNKKKTIRKMEKSHQDAINREFHDSFRAGWNAASTDPTTVKSAYNKIFKHNSRS